MFNINDNDKIRLLTNNRKEGAYVMPLYIKIYNSRYDSRDLDTTENYTPSALKIGYGAIYGMFCKQQFPIKGVDAFHIIKQFLHTDYEKNIDIRYIVFEESTMDEEMLKHPIIDQINYYYSTINEYLMEKTKVLRDKRIRQFLDEMNES